MNEHVFKNLIEDERARFAKSPATCTFRMLWLLFKPGSTVYVQTGGKLEARVVQAIYVDEAILSSVSKSYRSLTLVLWSLDFDGRFVGRRSVTVTIPQFDGERIVTSLAAFPCELLDRADGGKTRTKLETFGKDWFKLLRGGMIHYNGEFAEQKGSAVRYFFARTPHFSPITNDIRHLGIFQMAHTEPFSLTAVSWLTAHPTGMSWHRLGGPS